jgi:predicted nucleic acid-binding protein
MLYLVLARRNDAVLVTADADLAKASKRQRIVAGP